MHSLWKEYLHMKPYHFQEAAIENYKTWLDTPEPIATIILPMGLGKTYTGVKCVAVHPEKKYLWVAHSTELIDQALEVLTQELDPEVKITTEIAERKGKLDSQVVVASVQTLVRDRAHLKGWVPDVIFIDEYHHFSEDNVQYRSLRKRWPKAKIVGLSATLWRNDQTPIPLGTILVHMDIYQAIEEGYLVEPIFEHISPYQLKNLGQLSWSEILNPSAITDELMVKRIVKVIKEEGRKGILFASSTEHARSLAATMENQVRVGQVFYDTPTKIRNQIMTQMKNQELDVLVNFMIGVEGLNIPHLGFVAILRDLDSLNIFQQMGGRGLRKFDGKENCLILSSNKYSKADLKADLEDVSYLNKTVSIFGNNESVVKIMNKTVKPILTGVLNKLIKF